MNIRNTKNLNDLKTNDTFNIIWIPVKIVMNKESEVSIREFSVIIFPTCILTNISHTDK